MDFFPILNTLVYLEPLLWFVVYLCFRRSSNRLRFRWFGNFALMHSITALVMNAFLRGHHLFPQQTRLLSELYVYCYYIFYVVGVVLIIKVLMEAFQYAVTPLPGIQRLGKLVFRWVAFVSFTVAITTWLTAVPHGSILNEFTTLGFQIMRCVGVLELCLLAFLALTLQTLGLSLRSRVFGISMGFGMLAVSEIVAAAIIKPGDPMDNVGNYVMQFAMTGVLLLWSAYFVLPEPLRKPVMMPATSPLLRWNEIAKALGHGTPHVAVAESNSFFLQDVEKVVDRVLSRNSLTAVR